MNSTITSQRNTSPSWNKIDNYLLDKINEHKKPAKILEKVNGEGFYSEFSNRMLKSSTKIIDFIKPIFF